MLKAPFPWFGGKRKVVHVVWERFGDVDLYVEPFFGSGAVLLGRPTLPKVETINDLDCMVANFWRALKEDPDAVAYHATWPINEADLHARHTWLCNQHEFREMMHTDPDFFDVKIAGWWVWGISCWIGGGWCSTLKRTRPHLTSNQGIMCYLQSPLPERRTALTEYMRSLSDRLSSTRVCCGDWSRVVTPAVTYGKYRLTGVFLDPPYAVKRNMKYAVDCLLVSKSVQTWVRENWDNPKLRIALCGYQGEHDKLIGGERYTWTANGGFANQSNR